MIVICFKELGAQFKKQLFSLTSYLAGSWETGPWAAGTESYKRQTGEELQARSQLVLSGRSYLGCRVLDLCKLLSESQTLYSASSWAFRSGWSVLLNFQDKQEIKLSTGSLQMFLVLISIFNSFSGHPWTKANSNPRQILQVPSMQPLHRNKFHPKFPDSHHGWCFCFQAGKATNWFLPMECLQ